MKLKTFILVLMLLPALSYGQFNRLIDSYTIPTFSYTKLSLSGQDLFNYSKQTDLDSKNSYENTNASFSFSQSTYLQNPMATNIISSSLNYNYGLQKYILSDFGGAGLISLNKSSYCNFSATMTNNWYVGNYKGFFIYTNPSISYYYDFTNSYAQSSVSAAVGIGYGRVIALKTLLQACIITDEIKANLSDEDYQKLSDLITKYSNGFYGATYRNDSEIQFCKDISEITKKPEATMKIEQIINTSLYKTSARYSGLQGKLGLNFGYAFNKNNEDFEPNDKLLTDVTAEVDYGIPFNYDKQLQFSALCYKNVDDNDFRMPVALINASFTIDHNYHWTTTLSAGFNYFFPKNNSDFYNLYLSAKTDFLFLNSFSFYVSVGYSNINANSYSTYIPLANKGDRFEVLQTHIGCSVFIL